MSVAVTTLVSGDFRYRMIDLAALGLVRLPVIHRILIENIARCGGAAVVDAWLAGATPADIAFWPRRVLMHDTTCGPALVDLAAARSAIAEAGGDPARINPQVPVDVSTDHSLAVDVFGRPDAAERNMEREMARNAERYRFMRWAADQFDDFTVHPPGTGIMHTINLERLARVVGTAEHGGELWAVPDTLIGTDSHTPMVGGIGVLGWGVGGLEAESVMLGMPVMMRVPEVIGVRLTGALGAGVNATDLALTITAMLRGIALGGRFVEFFGPGVSTLSAGARATVANMAPEYGGATGYFPIDRHTLDYLAATGRSSEQVALVHDYAHRAGLWFDPDAYPDYAEDLHLDLGTVETTLAGPRRPQDRVALSQVPVVLGTTADPPATGAIPYRAVAIAAITSCTNTSDPRQLIAAGLLARAARVRGLSVPPWVKTVLAPGSPTAELLLARAGLLDDLAALGFSIAGYGCTVCIGNSGPLVPAMSSAIGAGAVSPVAILSGNRNFPGRVHAEITDAFLASPPLVVAYALLGDAAQDIAASLADLWPDDAAIDAALAAAADPADIARAYDAAEASPAWAALPAPHSTLYPWAAESTYLRRPPFASAAAVPRLGDYVALPILVLGDDVTTDHISPAGAIPPDSEAGRWLVERGADPADLNVYASRRGNWEVMLRGLFTNPTVRNLLDVELPSGSTRLESGEAMPLWRAADWYRDAGESVVIVAGDRYGMGSSRDWAAKGANLLGVRAVLATGFERIHRSNLINMGILPLRLPLDRHPRLLALEIGDRLHIPADAATIAPRGALDITILRSDGRTEPMVVGMDVETALEVEVLRDGGMIPLMLRRKLDVAHD